MAFFADAVAHFALPGVVLALVWHWDISGFLTIFCILAGLLITWAKDHSEVPTDTLMGVFSAGAIGAGVVLISQLDGYQGQLLNFLFGDILAVSWSDIGLLALLALAVGAFVLLTLQAQVLTNFHADLAQVHGVPVKWLNYAFIVLLAGVVATALKLVGALLVTAFLVVPAACARNAAQRFMDMLWIGPLVGVLGALLGVVLSAFLNTPSGPMIVLVEVGIFLGLLLLRRRALLVG
jgi:zinc/manganese transport system permease protein